MKRQKMRINLGQEFVIGGYMPGAHGVQSIIVGVYCDAQLQHVACVKTASCRRRDGQFSL
jgi:hypothetical protein